MGEIEKNNAIKEALEEVLSSETFRRTERLSEILSYIVKRYLDAGAESLNQKTIGADIFGIEYDARADYHLVRRSVNELRKKLALYYAGEGRNSSIRIWIPTGAYVPMFEETGFETVTDRAESGLSKTRLHTLLSVMDRRWKIVSSVSIACIMVIALILVLYSVGPTGGRDGDRVPASIRRDGNFFEVLNEKGERLWTGVLPGPIVRTNLIEDINGDGEKEVLVSDSTQEEGPEGGTLFCYSETGTRLWELPLAPPDQVPFRDLTRPGPFTLVNILSEDIDGDGRLELYFQAQHIHDFPTRLIRISAEGEILDSYWHPGNLLVLRSIDINEDGDKELLLGGCHDGYGQKAVLALLDPFEINGRAPAQIGTAQHAVGIPLAKHFLYILFTRCEMAEPYPEQAPMVERVVHNRFGLKVWTREPHAPQWDLGGVVYFFDSFMNLTRATLASTTMWSVCRDYRREHKLPEPDPAEIEEELASGVEIWREDRFVPIDSVENVLSTLNENRVGATPD